jgi:tetratricopeptide (TPR) repeat protein
MHSDVLVQAQQLLQTGQAEAALRLLEPQLLGGREADSGHLLGLDAYVRLGRREEGLRLLTHAASLRGSDPAMLDGLAFFARQLDRHELSNQLYRQAAESAESDANLWYNLATSERSLGRLAAAAEACERALALDPRDFACLLMRSELHRGTADKNNVAELQQRLRQAGKPQERLFLAFALGKELHDLERYPEAFEAFALGCRIRRQTLSYDVGQDERKIERIRTEFNSTPHGYAPLQSRAEHVFIVGLPRSGTTLTERILSALPGVRSNGETENFSAALLAHASSQGSDIFERCAKADFEAVGVEYARRASASETAQTIIEKLPLNYLYLGAIAAALPDARIVWVRRRPVDSCFAMFRTLFAAGYPFSYDFGDLARYYAAYHRLMTHWEALLGQRLFSIDYETLVAEPQVVGSALAQHCGLPWREDALDITQNSTPSLTASAAQVREPIYGRSAGVWRKYANQLSPLVAELERLGVEAR